MARPCSTCNHPDRAAIEIGLANGVACRVLGKRYGLDPSQLSRHRTKHMPDGLVANLRVRGSRSDAELAQLRELEGKSLLDNIVWQRGRMYANADRARAIGDDAGERAAMAEAGKATDRIGKLLDEYGSHVTINNTINLVASPQWHAIRTALVRELRPLGHEAMQAAARAIAYVETQELPSPVPAQRVLEHAA
ncbi:hypothetical protein [Pseudoxanthomonas sp. Soil82]|uniref:hypothetical protein n=1 Tax=Pseudoxanthomonas sp. Soil82 TaxID=3157341 RepID=UPI00338F6085